MLGEGVGNLLEAFNEADRQKLEALVTLAAYEEDLAAVLIQLLDMQALSVFVEPDVEGKVSICVHQKPLETVLQFLCEHYDISIASTPGGIYRIQAGGNVQNVTTDTEASASIELLPDAESEFQIRLMAPPQDREHVEVDYIASETEQGIIHLPMLKKVVCTGEDIAGAELQERPGEATHVLLTLTDAGADKMRSATANNLGNQLGIIFRGDLLAAPTIQDTVSGNVVVAGKGPHWEVQARELVEALQQP